MIPNYDQEIEKMYHPENFDRPEYNEQYALTGAPGEKCIANGNTWAESKVENKNKKEQKNGSKIETSPEAGPQCN